MKNIAFLFLVTGFIFGVMANCFVLFGDGSEQLKTKADRMMAGSTNSICFGIALWLVLE